MVWFLLESLLIQSLPEIVVPKMAFMMKLSHLLRSLLIQTLPEIVVPKMAFMMKLSHLLRSLLIQTLPEIVVPKMAFMMKLIHLLRSLLIQSLPEVWKKFHAKIYGLKPPKRCRDVDYEKQLGEPTILVQIEGDGNCFYRAISVELTGAQNSHDILRQWLAQFKLTSEMGKVIENYLHDTNKKIDTNMSLIM
ncbi:uncharacterized protein LOC135922181 [Gordionus sp. m RMFG-2023]|uniref:uncharacterized protein LOC135922181 n=1 Tax=Gordionus sp. m RMFG-2023 TaxID=3053472 RepID=UPI0031FDF054